MTGGLSTVPAASPPDGRWPTPARWTPGRSAVVELMSATSTSSRSRSGRWDIASLLDREPVRDQAGDKGEHQHDRDQRQGGAQGPLLSTRERLAGVTEDLRRQRRVVAGELPVGRERDADRRDQRRGFPGRPRDG